MNSPVIIKGNRYGLVLILDDKLPFNDLLMCLRDKFQSDIKFFDKSTKLALTIEGRELTNEELDDLLEIVQVYAGLNVQYVIDPSMLFEVPLYEDMLDDTSIETISDYNNKDFGNCFREEGTFYKGTLRSGQRLDVDSNIVIIGDINPGASVYAKGSIIVIGHLLGSAFAGLGGDKNAFIIALSMAPINASIRNVPFLEYNKKSNAKVSSTKENPRILLCYDNNIISKEICKSVFNEYLYN